MLGDYNTYSRMKSVFASFSACGAAAGSVAATVHPSIIPDRPTARTPRTKGEKEAEEEDDDDDDD